MVASVVAALLVFGQGASSPGPYEFCERVKELDQVWLATPDRARRLAAVPKVSAAQAAFLSQQFSDACRSLDEATAALRGKEPSAEDAISLRFDPPFVEPRTPAKLRISWAYEPPSSQTVRISVGRQNVVATPGRTLVVDVRPEALNPEILQNPEVGYLMPVQVGAEQRSVFLSIVKRPKERLQDLRDTRSPEARTLVEFLAKAFANPDSIGEELPLIQYLFTAELFDEGRLRPERADSLPLAKSRNTYFRAAFPRASKGALTLVIGLSNGIGSENMFFDAYGRGMAVNEAARRGWAFVSARESSTAVQDIVEWIKTRRKQAIGKVFILGHGEGARAALRSLRGKPKPSAVALFAPESSVFGGTAIGVPAFIAVGKQDSLIASVKPLIGQIASRKDCEWVEIEASGNLTIVADALQSAYRFFDAKAN